MAIGSINIKRFSNFFKVFSLTSVGSGVKLISSFILGKLFAVYYGPNGMVLIGQVNNLLTIGGNLSTLGTRFGMVKVSANSTDDQTRNVAFQSSLIFITLTYVILALICFVFHKSLTLYTFNDGKYSTVITILLLCLPVANIFTLVNSFLNGESKFRAQISMNIVGALFTFLVLMIYILAKAPIIDLLVGVIIANCFIGILSLYWLKDRYRFLIPKKAELLPYFSVLWKYGRSGLIISLWTPVSLLIIRAYVIDNFGPKDAGNWEVVTRSSALYLLFFFNAISTYFLPKFSSDNKYPIGRVFGIMLKALGASTVIFIIGYFLRYPLISFAFSSEFKGAGKLFAYQFGIDLIRITLYPLVMYMLGTSKLLIYGALEIAAPTLLVMIFALKIITFSSIGQIFALNLLVWLAVLIFGLVVCIINRHK